MKNKRKLILRWVLLAVVGVILGVNVYMANAKNLAGNRMPMPLGFGAAVVLSGSMEPELSVGDLILVAENDHYTVGDVVVFQDTTSLIVHRIVDVSDEYVITQGDANNASDEPIAKETIKGKVIMHIPFVGYAVNFLKTPIGIICVIAAAIALVEIPRRREKAKDDEEKEKILDEIKRLREEIKD